MIIENWALPAFVSFFFWGVAAFLPKLISDKLSTLQIIIYQMLGLVPFFAVIVVWQWGQIVTHPVGVMWGLLCGLFGYLGQLLYVAALRYGYVTPVSVLTSLYPVLTVILAHVFLQESLSLLQMAGIMLAIIALTLLAMRKDRHEEVHLGMWIVPALASLVMWGIWALLSKFALQTLRPIDVMIYESIGGFFIMLAALAALKGHLPFSRQGLLFGGGSGACVTVSVLAFFYAVDVGLVSVVSVMTALYPLVTIGLAIVFLKEKPSPRRLAAIGLGLCAIAMLVV